MKQAGISILKKDLELILSDYGISGHDIANICEKCLQYPLQRSLIITNKATKAKLEKTNSANVEQFNRLLEAARFKLKHRGVRQIMKSDRNYTLLCEIANDATEFSRLFELDLISGIKKYISIGLKRVGKNYRLNKFKTYKERIFDDYSKLVLIKEDQNKELTLEIASYYLQKAEIIDEHQQLTLFEKYHHDFIYCQEEIDANESDVRSWINAQFKGMQYLELIPEPYQLHGEGALERYLKHGKKTKDNWRERLKNKR